MPDPATKGSKDNNDNNNNNNNVNNNINNDDNPKKSKSCIDLKHPSTWTRNLFAWYGRFVANHPVWFVVCPLLFGALCMLSIPFLGVDIYKDHLIFTPYSSQSRKDHRIIVKNWPPGTLSSEWGVVITSVIIGTTDGSDILDDKRYHLVGKLNRAIMDNSNPPYSQMCHKDGYGRCVSRNSFVSVFSFLKRQNRTLTYPVFKVGGGSPFLLTGILGGVETRPGKTPEEGIIVKSTSMQLYYILNDDVNKTIKDAFSKTISNECARISSRLISSNESSNEPAVSAVYLTNKLFNDDLSKAGASAGGRLLLLIGLIFLVAFCLTFRILWTDGKVSIDKDQSALLIVFMGMTSSIMGCVFSYGFMFWCGAKFAPLFQLIPFLAIAVGVDDTLVILNTFRHTHSPGASLADRLAGTLEVAGIPVLFTSLTSIAAFMGGLLSDTPAIIMFTWYCTAAFAFNYLFLITFYIGVIALLVGDPCKQRCKPGQYADLNAKRDLGSYVIGNLYPQLLLTRWFYVPITLVHAAILVAACYGITQFESTASNLNYLQPQSPSAHFIRLAADQQLSGVESVFLPIFVNRVPNLTIAENRDDLENMVRAFENTEYTLPESGTVFWMRTYLRQYIGKSDPNVVHKWTDGLYGWTKINENVKHVGKSLVFRAPTKKERIGCDDCDHILAHCKLMISINRNYLNSRPEGAKHMMKIASEERFAHLQLALLPPGIVEAEQLAVAEQTNVRAMILCTCAVALMGMIFVGNITVAAWLVLMIISINIMNTGFMGLFGVPLNLMTMLVLFAGVGISVDYTIHIASVIAHSPLAMRERLRKAVQETGLPIGQCALTTIAGCMALHGVKVDMFRHFYHTLLLVVVVGFVHAVVFLPALLLTTQWLVDSYVTKLRLMLNRKKVNVAVV